MQIRVVQNVLEKNKTVACENRDRLTISGVLCMNVLSAPGSGKTSLLQKTIARLNEEHPCAVLVGDLQTTRDAERLADVSAQVVQINTGRGCHLTASQVEAGLNELNLDGLSFVFIENVGNMVCPAGFDLGEHARAILLSTPEGSDKVAKYPILFQTADVILLSKIDLSEVLEYHSQQVSEDLERINTRAPLIEVSAKTNVGIEPWVQWLLENRSKRVGGLLASST
ncbi:MAG: hydrogenase nickel incorporation protein HypB [Planctomycetota bacterium]|nr:hydrogenase nickel incorporation protein HypB [Planctomycetota bacterium]